MEITRKMLDGLFDQMSVQYPGLKIVRKPGVLGHRCTTIGSVIYVPMDWDVRSAISQYITLVHEERHLHQFQHARFGTVGFLVQYVCSKGFRFQMESEAYRAEMRAYYLIYGEQALRRRQPIYVNRLSGSSYYSMIPKTFAHFWVEQTIETIVHEENG